MNSPDAGGARPQRSGWRYLAIIFGAAWLAAFVAARAAGPPVCDVGAGDDIGCARGFETRERDNRGSFRWTDGQAAVVLAASGYGAPLVAEMLLAAPRPADVPPPHTRVIAGSTAFALTPASAPRWYRFLVSPGFPAGDALTISIAGDTWKPPRDRRDLGVMLYTARIRPVGLPALPPALHTLAMLAMGLAAARAAHNPWRHPARGALPVLGALAAIGCAATLWVWLPARSVPFLPLYALLAGGMALLPSWRASAETSRSAGRWPWPVLQALAGGAVIDALFVTGLAHGLWSVPAVAIQAGLTLGAVWGISGTPAPRHAAVPSLQPAVSLLALLQITLFVRLLALAVRLLGGAGSSDPDVELFYSYGRATLELGVPLVEYPSGALIPWAFLALPASREFFALALPLVNTGADMALVWAIWLIGHRRSRMAEPARQEEIRIRGSALALFYAISPLLLPFWHGKYDSLPTALLALGLAAFACERWLWAGVALGVGGTVKWVPWLAAPGLALALLRPASGQGAQRIRRDARLLRFAAGGALAVAAVSLPFAVHNFERFLAPYLLQGGRAITGESLWFLAMLITEPALWQRLPVPWGPVETGGVLLGIAVVAQLATLLGLTLLPLAQRSGAWRALALAALVPAAFLLLNRVFSPQYLVTITGATLIAGAAVVRSRRDMLEMTGWLAVAQAANLLVWPNTIAWWPVASALMFVAALLALMRVVTAR